MIYEFHGPTPTIRQASISPPKDICEAVKNGQDPRPLVSATYTDGSQEDLFRYYHDEISFHPDEFIGLTREQALRLYTEKDIAYLKSETFVAACKS